MKTNRFTKIVLLLVCAALFVPLAGYGIVGTTARYWADDYCHSADIFVEGFWRAQAVVYVNSSDRYSVEPLVGISELFGRSMIQYLPALVIVLWLMGLVWALRQGVKTWRLPLSWAGTVLLAETLIFFTLLEAPNRFQSLYWRAGMLTYLCPLVANTFLVGLMLWQLQRGSVVRTSRWGYLWVGITAFFAGGFSETSAALQTGYLSLVLLVAWLWVKRASRRRALKLLMAALIGSLLSMLVLFLSPAAHLRQSGFETPPGLFTLTAMSLRHGLDFMLDTLKVVPLPTAVSFTITFLLSAIAHCQYLLSPSCGGGVEVVKKWRKGGDGEQQRWSLQHIGLMLLLSLFGGYLLVVCTMAPSVYAYRAYPEPRALITSRFVMVLLLACLGWLAGAIFSRLAERLDVPVRGLAAASLVLLLLASAYPLRTASQMRGAYTGYQSQASLWDERDSRIRTMKAAGEMDIDVEALDSIGTIGDLSTDQDNWLNVCVARFYGLRSIAAPPQ